MNKAGLGRLRKGTRLLWHTYEVNRGRMKERTFNAYVEGHEGGRTWIRVPMLGLVTVVNPEHLELVGARENPEPPMELDLATNMFGKLKSGPRSKIMALIERPSQKTWDNAHGVILNSQWMTLWQAILAVDPTFPRTGPSTDARGRVLEKWPRIPSVDLVLRALKYATH